MGTDGPFGTRAQAELRYAAFRGAALLGRSGPPGEQLVFSTGQLPAETLADILHTVGVELGAYDRAVIGRLALLLDPVDVAVVGSLLQRAAGDSYDTAVYAAAWPRDRDRPRPPQTWPWWPPDR